MEQKKLMATDFIRNTEIHKTKYFGGSKAYPHVTWEGPFIDSSYGMYNGSGGEVMKKFLDDYGFYTDVIFKTLPVSEWVFSFIVLEPGHKTGLGYTLLPDVKYSLKEPESRQEALAIIKDWLFRQYKEEILDAPTWDSCPGYYLWSHYAGEWGCDSVGAETGESINHTQASIAFTRGAGRQYGIPFYIDISPWFRSTKWGHSPSMLERHAMAAHMGGAAFVMAEGGGWGLVESATGNLTKHGVVFKKVADFMKKYPDTGCVYTPFALALDYYHGMYPNDRFSYKSFGRFPYEAPDYMTWNLINLFFPGGWESKWDESDYLVNSSFGDTCDALLQTASQEVLNSYPCVILTGDIQFSEEEITRYVQYVKQGGTLVMNTAYLKFFGDYQAQYAGGVQTIADGDGEVIVYGPDFDITALDGIIREQYARFVPFSVTEKIEHLIKIKDGAMYVTLINNEGYTKTPTDEPIVDETKAKSVTVTYTGDLALTGVAEIYDETPVSLADASVTITVKPGETKVLEFRFID